MMNDEIPKGVNNFSLANQRKSQEDLFKFVVGLNKRTVF